MKLDAEISKVADQMDDKNHGVTDGSLPKSPSTPERKAETLPSLATPSGQSFIWEDSTVKTSREQKAAMIAQLRLHEGERLFPYNLLAASRSVWAETLTTRHNSRRVRLSAGQ